MFPSRAAPGPRVEGWGPSQVGGLWRPGGARPGPGGGRAVYNPVKQSGPRAPPCACPQGTKLQAPRATPSPESSARLQTLGARCPSPVREACTSILGVLGTQHALSSTVRFS